MTDQAYEEYIQACKKRNITPSPRKLLESDPIKKDEPRPQGMHIIKPKQLQKKQETPMSKKIKIQDRFDSMPDDEILSITKGQLVALVEKVKDETIENHTKNSLINADEIMHAIKEQ